MQDLLDLHDGLDSIRDRGRCQGFVAGMIFCAAVTHVIRNRKNYTIVKTDTGFKATTEK